VEDVNKMAAARVLHKLVNWLIVYVIPIPAVMLQTLSPLPRGYRSVPIIQLPCSSLLYTLLAFAAVYLNRHLGLSFGFERFTSNIAIL